MAKASPKPGHFDVFILGAHFSAHIAAAALKHDHPKLNVGQTALPAERDCDRLTMVNPRLFGLHKILEKLAKDKSFAETFGLWFLSESANVRGEFSSKTATSLIVSMQWFTDASARLAAAAGVDQRAAKQVTVTRVIDDGIELSLDGHPVTARILIVASPLPLEGNRLLGIPAHGEDDVTHHYRFLRLKAPKAVSQMLVEKTVPMSLDLGGTGVWAWALAHGDSIQLAVAQPARGPKLPVGRDLATWISNLIDHGVFKRDEKLPSPEDATTIELPVAGALVGETVANRTLLIGRAGGFVSACAEEIYPGCWSAVLAAGAAARALKERHVQDALAGFRAAWGSTLGDYLRGPQQNLKLLLPLVYRNPIMAARVAEAILLGESVVR